MEHMKSPEQAISIEESAQGFEYWLNRPFVSKELRDDISKADILIVPIEGIREYDGPLFPAQTEGILTYLKNNVPANHTVDICIQSEDFNELALHSDTKNIGKFVVHYVLLQVFIGLLTGYIKDEISADDPESTIKVAIIVQQDSTSIKEFKFEGDPANFDNAVKSIKDLWEDE